jgi:hypothetical protein
LVYWQNTFIIAVVPVTYGDGNWPRCRGARLCRRFDALECAKFLQTV